MYPVFEKFPKGRRVKKNTGTLKMENLGGWGFLCEIPSTVWVWIFSGATHCKFAISTYTVCHSEDSVLLQR